MRSAFGDVERHSVFDRREVSLDELVARALSFSANSPTLLGEDGRAAYEAEVRDKMTAIEPSGRFPEIVESVAVIARGARANSERQRRVHKHECRRL